MALENIKVNNTLVTTVDNEPIEDSNNLVKSGGTSFSIRTTQLNSCGAIYTFKNGFISDYGTLIVRDESLTTDFLRIGTNPVKIHLNKGYSCTAVVKNSNQCTPLGYIIRDGGTYIYSGGNEYLAINVANVGTSRPMSPTEKDLIGLDIMYENSDRDQLNTLNSTVNTINNKSFGKDLKANIDIWKSVVNDQGIIVNSNSRAYRTDYIPLDGYSSIYADLKIDTNYFVIAFFNNSKEPLLNISIAPVDKEPHKYNIDITQSQYSTVKYVIFSNYAYEDYGCAYLIRNTLESNIDNHESRINKLESEFINILNISINIQNSCVNNQGVIINHNEDAFRSDFIDITNFYRLKANVAVYPDYFAIAFFDYNKEPLINISIEPETYSQTTIYDIDLTQQIYKDAKYVILSNYNYTKCWGQLLPSNDNIYLKISEIEYDIEDIKFQIGGNKIKDKVVSILGDSISTYEGYIPEGYLTFYPRGNVDNVNKTWWKKLIDESEAILGVNNSYSGSCVAYNGNGRPYFASIERLSNLGNPDIIIIFGSHNDWYWEVPLGEPYRGLVPDASHPLWNASTEYNVDDYVLQWGELYKCNTSHTSKSSFVETYWDIQYDVSKVSQAYQYIISYLQKNYPFAKIYCCTSIQGHSLDGKGGQLCKKKSFGQETFIPYSSVELDSIIREVCSQFGVEFVDLDKCGVTMFNCRNYTTDGTVHPNESGMELIKNCILRKIYQTF